MAESALSCAKCGVQFERHISRGRLPKFCASCRPAPKGQRQPMAMHPCVVCRNPFYARLSTPYCGWKCRDRAKGVKDRGDILATAGCRQEHECQHCRRSFRPKRAAHTQFCSRECGYAHRKANAVGKKVGHCADCGGVTSSPKVDRCSDCHKARVAALKLPPKAMAVPATKPCADCGCAVPYFKYVRRCDQCKTARLAVARKAARLVSRQSPSRRADKAYRKALERGRMEGAERFDPIQVLDRDKWRCHICGMKTPKALRGTYDNLAPELDHLIPLAAGGQHTMANTACACRKCNSAKGATPIGQLRLFG